jgi:hypothetical protein
MGIMFTELNRIYYEREKEQKELNDLMEDALLNWNPSNEEKAIYAEEDRLYRKSLTQDLTDEEEHNMCGGLR